MTGLQLGIALVVIFTIALLCIFERMAEMAADLTALKTSVANAVARLNTAVADYKTAKENAADPAELAQMKTDLDTAVSAADAVLNPAPAGS